MYQFAHKLSSQAASTLVNPSWSFPLSPTCQPVRMDPSPLMKAKWHQREVMCMQYHAVHCPLTPQAPIQPSYDLPRCCARDSSSCRRRVRWCGLGRKGRKKKTRVREERRSKRTGGQGGREEVTEGEEGQEGEEREEGRGGRGSGGRSRLQPVQACASLTRARPPTLSSGTDPPLSLLRPRVSKDRCKSYNCSPRALTLGPARALESELYTAWM